MQKNVEILDTIRDASQDPELSLSLEDRIHLAKLSDELGSDFIELNWPQLDNPSSIAIYHELQGKLKHAKLVAFTSTAKPRQAVNDDKNLNAVLKTGAKYATIFGKTWKKHVLGQLKISPEENLKLIEDSVRHLSKNGVETFFDAEHFFLGFKDDPIYAMKVLDAAYKGGATKLVLCDTLGNIDEKDIKSALEKIIPVYKGNKNITIGLHGHNDRNLSVSNVATFVDELLRYGLKAHVQGTINGLGERLGNASLTDILPELMLFRNVDIPNISLNKLTSVSKNVATITGTDQTRRLSYVHPDAFKHKGGVHADAILKIGPEAYNPVNPELVGNKTWIIYTDQGGASGMAAFANQVGYTHFTKEHKRISHLRKKAKAQLERGYDLNYSEDVARLFMLRNYSNKPVILEVPKREITTVYKKGEDISTAKLVNALIKDKKRNLHEIEEVLSKSKRGPVSATFKAIKKIYSAYYPGVDSIEMEYFGVKVLKNKIGNDYSSATVLTPLIFTNGVDQWTMIGVSPDIQTAATEAIRDAFDYAILMKYVNGK